MSIIKKPQDYLMDKTILDSNRITKLQSYFDQTVTEWMNEQNDYNKRYWQGKMQGLEDALLIIKGEKVHGY